MKKVMFLMIVTILFVGGVEAQDNEPTSTGGYLSFLGGNLNFNLSHFNYENHNYGNQKDKYMTFEATPVIGFKVSENTALGIAINFTMMEAPPDDIYGYSNNEKSLGLSAFLRTYTNIAGKFKLYYEPFLGRTYYIEDESDKDIIDYYVGLNLGMLYFIKPKFSIEVKIASAMYENISIINSDYEANVFDLNYDIIQPNFGLKFYFK